MGIQEVDPHKYIQLILTAKVINGGMTVCLTNGAGIIGCPYGKKKKKNLDIYLALGIKLNENVSRTYTYIVN